MKKFGYCSYKIRYDEDRIIEQTEPVSETYENVTMTVNNTNLSLTASTN